jgi:PadR family transcriptional regulator PadR
MNIENTQSQMRKGVLEFCILSIIQREEAYPSDIIEEMKKAHLNILEGTLYPLLTRLKNADLLAYRWVESSGGPPRKYFSLTEKGAAFYKELETTWREMSDSVERVIGNKKELNLPAEGREAEGLSLPAKSTAIERAGLPGEGGEVEGIKPSAGVGVVEEMKLAEEGQGDPAISYQPEANKNTEESSTTDQPNP